MKREKVTWAGLALLEEFCEAFGVSGFEGEIRERIRRRVEPLADEVQTDPMGNLCAVLNPSHDFTLMLDAHMDEVGLVVRSIEEDGFLRLAPIGLWDVRTLPGQRVVVRSRVGEYHPGVIGSTPPHIQAQDDRDRVFAWKDLYVDVGSPSASAVKEMQIRPGSPILLPQTLIQTVGQAVLGKALDNRIGCAILVRTMAALFKNRPQVRVVASFSTTEEVGFRGARVAARRWKPQMAYVLETSLAQDTPGFNSDQRMSRLGLGPVLTAVDEGVIVPEALLEQIISLAEEMDIPWQIKTVMKAATNGGAIQTSAQGTLTAVISVPCRYVHSPGCLARLKDLTATERLVEAAVRQAPKIYKQVCADTGPMAQSDKL